MSVCVPNDLRMNTHETVPYLIEHSFLLCCGCRKRGTGATPDWSGDAELTAHLWAPYSTSEECYLPDTHCTRRGHKNRCSVCKIVVHGDCIDLVTSQMKWTCRQTFREVDIRSYRDESKTEHHWVLHRYAKGKCSFCSKSLQPKKLFIPKDLLVTTCTWCKKSYHNRDSCFNSEKVDPVCNLGSHANIVVPPTWILKLQNKGDFKSSLRLKKKPVDAENVPEEPVAFIVKAIPTAGVNPVIVFINPKSGGNQGVKLLQKFQWLLNPRQVFDLTQGGPNMGLELFKRVPQLRVLACGGDGTVGWVLSVIDKIGFAPPPAVGVLPLGTGNDLARALGWGGGYTDEPISKILTNIGNSEVTMLDRWKLTVEKNPNGNAENGNDNLPLNVVNNYFSLGVDAHIALEFHQAREAHPEKFNSRLRNKMFYGQRGGKDLVRRKWKALSDYVTLTCDGNDYTPVLKEHKFHAIVFLNIPSYGGGTRPWPKGGGCDQSTEDGMIEVVGLTTFQLPLLQAGGHGDKICQCKTARIETTKTIPMQVDGEACKLNPSIINLELLNRAAMLAKRKSGSKINANVGIATVKINVKLLKMFDYEQHYHDKNQLKKKAFPFGDLEVSLDTDLEQVRSKINELLSKAQLNLSSEWCFVDSCTAGRFFRIDRAQENLHYITDISNEELFILEAPKDVTEMETALPSPSSEYNKNEFSVAENASRKISIMINDEPMPNQNGEYRQSVKEICRKIEAPHSTNVLSKTFSVATGFRIINPNNSNFLGKSSNHVLEAAKSGDLKKLKELHSEGYSLQSQNSNGETALHFAAYYGKKDIIKYLITSAPHQILNITEEKKGQTALHRAVISRHKNICCMLVAAGASLSIQDSNGKTPKDLSLDNEITAYLESQEEFQKMGDFKKNAT